MSKVRIVGLGTMIWEERCILTDDIATGYVEDIYSDMVPVKLSILGPGKLGQLVELPPEYRQIAKEKGVINYVLPFVSDGNNVVDAEGSKKMECDSQWRADFIAKALNS